MRKNTERGHTTLGGVLTSNLLRAGSKRSSPEYSEYQLNDVYSFHTPPALKSFFNSFCFHKSCTDVGKLSLKCHIKTPPQTQVWIEDRSKSSFCWAVFVHMKHTQRVSPGLSKETEGNHNRALEGLFRQLQTHHSGEMHGQIQLHYAAVTNSIHKGPDSVDNRSE